MNGTMISKGKGNIPYLRGAINEPAKVFVDGTSYFGLFGLQLVCHVFNAPELITYPINYHWLRNMHEVRPYKLYECLHPFWSGTI